MKLYDVIVRFEQVEATSEQQAEEIVLQLLDRGDPSRDFVVSLERIIESDSEVNR